MLRRLSHDKQVFGEDLFMYIPQETPALIQINKVKDADFFGHLFPELDKVLVAIKSKITYPLLIVKDESPYIVTRVTFEQEKLIKTVLDKDLFGAFPPKKRVYKGVNIFFYPSINNDFFVCMFYNGIFAGGFNYNFLEKIIDTDSTNSILNHKDINDLIKEMNTNYSANMIFRSDSGFQAFNAAVENQRLQLSGYINGDSIDSIWECSNKHNDSVSVDYSIFPDPLLSYIINYKESSLSKDFVCFFDPPLYGFCIDTVKRAPIYVLKYNTDRFDIFEKLNRLELSYIQRKLSTKDIVLNRQHIYTTSTDLAKEVFGKDIPVILTFYKGYLIFTTSRDVLIDYLKVIDNSQKNYGEDNELKNEIGDENFTVQSFYHINDLSQIGNDVHLGYLSLFKDSFKTVSITNTRIAGRQKVDIILNN